MPVRQILFVLCFTLLLLPSSSYGQELNAGFVRGLWYGSESTIANEPTRIYIAFRNNTEHDLTGIVRFHDNQNPIGTASVSALPGRIVEAWVDWTPDYGEHIVVATLSDVRVHPIGKTAEIAQVADTIAQDLVFADRDTDKDGIANENDTDDDNDTVSDTDEKANGTNPLIADPLHNEKAPEDEEAVEDGATEPHETPQTETRSTPTESSRVGLERYAPEGVLQTAAGSLTETINTKKAELDVYRDNRRDSLQEYFDRGRNAQIDPDGEAATITRSTMPEKETFLESALHGGKALVSGFYSLILWVVSNALAHPAVLELVLLLLIVYILYRTARRLGKRRALNT